MKGSPHPTGVLQNHTSLLDLESNRVVSMFVRSIDRWRSPHDGPLVRSISERVAHIAVYVRGIPRFWSANAARAGLVQNPPYFLGRRQDQDQSRCV